MLYKILKRHEQRFITLDSIKNYLRISHDYDDEWIMSLVNATIEAAESFLRSKVLKSDIEVIIEYNSGGAKIALPVSPVLSVTKITARSNGHDTVLHAEDYELRSEYIVLGNLPLWHYLKIEYVAGFEDAEIPHMLRQGIMLHIAEMYDNRGTVSSISSEVQKLYQPYRKMMI